MPSVTIYLSMQLFKKVMSAPSRIIQRALLKYFALKEKQKPSSKEGSESGDEENQKEDLIIN